MLQTLGGTVIGVRHTSFKLGKEIAVEVMQIRILSNCVGENGHELLCLRPEVVVAEGPAAVHAGQV